MLKRLAIVERSMTRRMDQLAADAGIALDIEPFAVIQGHTARRAARAITATYGRLEATPGDKLAPIVLWLLETCGFGADHPYARAARPIAEAIEARDTPRPVNPYHNAHHTLEVVLNAHYLAARNDVVATMIRLTPREHGLLCLAALIHDFEHDGTMNGKQRFRLEQLANDTATPFFDEAGISAEDQAVIKVTVLATDPAGPNLYMKSLHSHEFYGGPTPDPATAYAELAPLAQDRRLLRLAGLLNDADLMSSAGLSLDYSRRQSDKLGAEGGRYLDCNDMLRFLSHIVGGSFTTRAGRFFNTNMFLIKSFSELGMSSSDDGIPAPLIRP